jgi:hypothetical protein
VLWRAVFGRLGEGSGKGYSNGMPSWIKFFNREFFHFASRFLIIVSASLILLYVLAPYA